MHLFLLILLASMLAPLAWRLLTGFVRLILVLALLGLALRAAGVV